MFGKAKHDPDLAYALFNAFLASMPPKDKISKKAHKIAASCKTAKDIYLKVIELCGEGDSVQQRCIRAIAYSKLGAKYRPQAIEYMNQYLNGPLYERDYAGIHHSICGKQFSEDDELKIYKGSMLETLATAYEGTYQFEEAYKSFMLAYKLTPFYPTALYGESRVLIKMGKIDDAISILSEAKHSAYYGPQKWTGPLGNEFTDDTFQKVIDSALADAIDKKNRGYVYRPRKK